MFYYINFFIILMKNNYFYWLTLKYRKLILVYELILKFFYIFIRLYNLLMIIDK